MGPKKKTSERAAKTKKHDESAVAPRVTRARRAAARKEVESPLPQAESPPRSPPRSRLTRRNVTAISEVASETEDAPKKRRAAPRRAAKSKVSQHESSPTADDAIAFAVDTSVAGSSITQKRGRGKKRSEQKAEVQAVTDSPTTPEKVSLSQMAAQAAHLEDSTDKDRIGTPVRKKRAREASEEAESRETPNENSPLDVRNRVMTPVRRGTSLHKRTVLPKGREPDEATAENQEDKENSDLPQLAAFPQNALATCDAMAEKEASFEVGLKLLPTIPDLAFDLPMPSECDMLCRLYRGLEQAWRERRMRHQPLLLSYDEGIPSLARHVERLTHSSLKLSHVRKIAWLAPHLVHVSWKQKVKFDVHTSEADHWDLEVAPRDPQTGNPVLRMLNLDESLRRDKEFMKICLLWVKNRHDEFLMTEEPPIKPIAFEKLASWHADFRLENDHVKIPQAPVPSRPWVAAAAARRRDSVNQIRKLSPWRRATPLEDKENSGETANRQSILGALCTPSRGSVGGNQSREPATALSRLAVTPLRSRTSAAGRNLTASPADDVVMRSATPDGRRPYTAPSQGTPIRSATLQGSILPQTPTRGLKSELTQSPLRTPYTALAKMSLSAQSTPFTSRSANRFGSTSSAMRGRSPGPDRIFADGDVSRMTPEQRRVWSRTKSREREKNIEDMLRTDLDVIEGNIRRREDCVKCFEVCVSIFLRSERPMLQLPAVCKRVSQTTALQGGTIDMERAQTALKSLAEKCPEVINLTPSKADPDMLVLNFQRQANLSAAKERLLSDLKQVQKSAEDQKRTMLQQYEN